MTTSTQAEIEALAEEVAAPNVIVRQAQGFKSFYTWCEGLQARIRALAATASTSSDLCDDEGCPHHGTPHVCIPKLAVTDGAEARPVAYRIKLFVEDGTFNWNFIDKPNNTTGPRLEPLYLHPAPPAPEVKAEARVVEEPAARGRIIDGKAVTVSLNWTPANDEPLYAEPQEPTRAMEIIERAAALIEAPPAPSQEMSAARRVRHKKTGGEYEVIGVGRMQAEDWEVREYTATDDPVPGASVDMREVTIYRALKDGNLWVRPVEEFEDGRFELLTQEPSVS